MILGVLVFGEDIGTYGLLDESLITLLVSLGPKLKRYEIAL